jgi:hypothetical protein
MSARSFKPALAAKVLEFLGDGSPPFLTIAAQRAGANPKIVEWWVASGSEEFADPNAPQTQFALEVRRIQAEYTAEKTRELAAMTNEDKNATERARRVTWILTCLNRTVFDLSRPPKEAPKGETDKPNKAQSINEIMNELANPKLQ